MNGKYLCKKTYDDSYEEYGVDFYAEKIYEYKDGYMHSTENGTDLYIPLNELKEYWTKMD